MDPRLLLPLSAALLFLWVCLRIFVGAPVFLSVMSAMLVLNFLLKDQSVRFNVGFVTLSVSVGALAGLMTVVVQDSLLKTYLNSSSEVVVWGIYSVVMTGFAFLLHKDQTSRIPSF